MVVFPVVSGLEVSHVIVEHGINTIKSFFFFFFLVGEEGRRKGKGNWENIFYYFFKKERKKPILDESIEKDAIFRGVFRERLFVIFIGFGIILYSVVEAHIYSNNP